MYAVIESGNKQYRVELGTEIQVDRLDVRAGDSITLDLVLLIADGDATAIGQPVVEGATVSADVVGQHRGEKIVVFKYKPKARHRVKKGFRAELTTLRISDIAFDGRSAAKDAQESEAKKSKAAKAAEKAAADKAAADIELAAKLAADAPAETATAKEATPEAKEKPEAKETKTAAKAAKPEANAAADENTSSTTSESGATADAAVPEADTAADAAPEAPEPTDDTQKDG